MSEAEKCAKCGELKTACKCDQKTESGIKEIKVTVDTKGTEDILGRLKAKEIEVDSLKVELEKEKEFKKKAETSFEEEKTAKEDYENKLKLIGEKKMTEEREIIMTKAKEVIKDPAKLKEIEEGIKDPESLKATKVMVQTFVDVLAQGEKEHKDQMDKEKQEFDKKFATQTGGKGNVGLRSEDLDKEKVGGVDDGKVGYESHAAMIRDLRKKSHSDNPEEAAFAKSVLEDLFKKWADAVKKNYEGKAQGGLGEIGPHNPKEQPSLRDITKRGGESIIEPKKDEAV